ncbi:hypothetical protein I7I53_05146 [Histoplasma capsulatum var. duboisii H88]|uniref:Uncharacterized protein n=1 Tax=Ajellomyces capsulatus (strain H88) TaxID=544711 RepID=A0A8A1LRE0_AJEC8|nr:hypothetical protein I7I53_05146 [Histoplasma capsulatum var. duboisii H88]
MPRNRNFRICFKCSISFFIFHFFLLNFESLLAYSENCDDFWSFTTQSTNLAYREYTYLIMVRFQSWDKTGICVYSSGIFSMSNC